MNGIYFAMLSVGFFILWFSFVSTFVYVFFMSLFDKRTQIIVNPLSGWRRLKYSESTEAKAMTQNDKVAFEVVGRLFKGRRGLFYAIAFWLAIILIIVGLIGIKKTGGFPHQSNAGQKISTVLLQDIYSVYPPVWAMRLAIQLT